MRVLLINMPWASIEFPSLALGILANRVTRTVPDADVEVLHANLEYADWITARTDFTGDSYEHHATDTYFLGCGDWVFSAALHGVREWRREEFVRRYANRLDPADLDLSVRLHASAPEFIAELADRVLDLAPDVVGFTSTYQQNVASLALAQQLKARDPRLVTVFGGANFDGVQGEGFHRNFPCVDYAIRGEGEAAFPALLTALRTGAGFENVDGLCWRAAGGPVANPMSTRPLPPAEIEAPDYDGYFERLARSAARHWTDAKLLVEGSRGCWWGEKHHCTFCGLNGSFMEFRSKTPERFTDELLGLVRRHQVLDVFVVDNILDMGYLSSVLPRLRDSGYDLRLPFEIKANMRRSQVETLRDAGLVFVQPGIENLSGHVLDLMDKGVTGCQNVRLMRDSESLGVHVTWNLLYGFPGETDEDYLSILEQFPALHHLAQPESCNRIALERFSPYFDRPELGFADKHPHPQYALLYDLPEKELADCAYLFDVPARGIGDTLAATVAAAVAEWQRAHPRARFTYRDQGDHILLVSHRAAFDWTVKELREPHEIALFRLLDQPRRPAHLAARLGTDEPHIRQLLCAWRELGIVFTDGGQYLQVATETANQDVLHLGGPLDRLRRTTAAARAGA